MFKRWASIEEENSIIIGTKRSGKSTILKMRFPHFKYVTLDDLDLMDWAMKDPKGFILSLGDKAVIDEIQRVPKLTIAVKNEIDQNGKTFLMTGSSSLGLLDASADTLVGRARWLEFPTCCWGEEEGDPTHKIFEDEMDPIVLNMAQRKLELALKYGGFPEVLNQESNDLKTEVLKLYKNTYFTRDLAQLSNIDNVEGLLAVLGQISQSICSHLEVSNFAREAGLAFVTAKKYLNILFQSQLTFKLYGYHLGPAKRYVKASKTYFSDNGIIEALGTGPSKGQILENFVLSEIEKRRKLGFIKSSQLFYYKSSGGAEIDLILEEEDHLKAIEIKSSKVIQNKDLRNLKDFIKGSKKSVKGYLFYLGSEYKEIDSIKCLPIASIYRGN